MNGDSYLETDRVAEALVAVLAPKLGDVTVEALGRLTGGANRETWTFDAVAPTGTRHELILQRDRAGVVALLDGCAREAEVLKCAAAHRVPVAEVVVSQRAPNALERSFSIATRIAGETIGRRILRDDEWERGRQEFVPDCAEALAKIHGITPDGAPGLDLLHVHDPLAPLLSTYLAFDDPHPAFELAFRWLELNPPERLGTCLVHGDFRLGNLIVDSEGLAAVLDWELAHFGDPAEDLGWMCVRAWRFGGPEPVAGMGSYQQLLDAYEQASGLAVSFDTLRWWEIYGTLRWGIICLQLGGEFRSGRTASIEMATIGRRVVENEYDVLALLP